MMSEPTPPPVKKERRTTMRTVRVGKWSSEPSEAGKEFVTKFLERYFNTDQVWTRKEHSSYVVAVRENVENTAFVEEFRFNRTMEQRFTFAEVNGIVEVGLLPLL